MGSRESLRGVGTAWGLGVGVGGEGEVRRVEIADRIVVENHKLREEKWRCEKENGKPNSHISDVRKSGPNQSL